MGVGTLQLDHLGFIRCCFSLCFFSLVFELDLEGGTLAVDGSLDILVDCLTLHIGSTQRHGDEVVEVSVLDEVSHLVVGKSGGAEVEVLIGRLLLSNGRGGRCGFFVGDTG